MYDCFWIVPYTFLVPLRHFGRLLRDEKALQSFYKIKIPKNLNGVGKLLFLTILTDHLNVPRRTALPTVLVIRILVPKQKAILRANIYFLIIHREYLHDFLCIVHAFRQFMTLREAVSPYSQECFEAFLVQTYSALTAISCEMASS